jgi:hypothetical protein
MQVHFDYEDIKDIEPNIDNTIPREPTAGRIHSIRLQVLGGRKPNDVLLETIIDTSTCPQPVYVD